ncbi:tetratricopeptide repeat-containing sulfotransferase family protein [Hyphobacterium sp.]|uniref:tetratricopeptide repeat-containing sulfotransferase family protein n=1 Tax=Hyphobacterium sp. TaxID=2004662 RepID=UPI003BABB6F6
MTALLKQAQAALTAGNAQAALQASQAAVRANPNDATAHYLSAAALRLAGRAGEALKTLDMLNRQIPDQPDLINMAGLCRRDMGDRAGAQRDFEQVVRLRPDHAPAIGNLASLLAGPAPEKAIPLFEKLAALQPQNPEPLAIATGLSLRLRDLDGAKALAGRAASIDPDAWLVRSAQAAIALAEDDAGTARTRLEPVMASARGAPALLATAWGRLAEACHKLKDPAAAFNAWQSANDIQRAASQDRFATYDGPRSLASAERLANWFSNHDPAPPEVADLTGPAPVFQVGFPRSGTTLLEQMLDAHPDIETLEEQDAIGPVIRAVGDRPETLSRLDTLSAADINAIRAAYWQQARPDGPPPSGRIFIDKYPMNLVWLGPLMRIFPDAKIILCLRDPRDCVLSAFQQRFAVNPEMYRTLRIGECAQLYDAAMRAGQAALASKHAVPVHALRYEDLIADWRPEITRALEFLGAGWHDEVAAYRERAANKAIKTPSAPQVVKPLYKGAIGKWSAYRFVLEPALPVLAPWIDKYGYEAS